MDFLLEVTSSFSTFLNTPIRKYEMDELVGFVKMKRCQRKDKTFIVIFVFLVVYHSYLATCTYFYIIIWRTLNPLFPIVL